MAFEAASGNVEMNVETTMFVGSIEPSFLYWVKILLHVPED